MVLCGLKRTGRLASCLGVLGSDGPGEYWTDYITPLKRT